MWRAVQLALLRPDEWKVRTERIGVPVSIMYPVHAKTQATGRRHQTIVKRDVVFTVMPPSGHSVLAALRSSATESATAPASRLGNCHGH